MLWILANVSLAYVSSLPVIMCKTVIQYYYYVLDFLLLLLYMLYYYSLFFLLLYILLLLTRITSTAGITRCVRVLQCCLQHGLFVCI